MERGESASVKWKSVDKTAGKCYSVLVSALGADFFYLEDDSRWVKTSQSFAAAATK